MLTAYFSHPIRGASGPDATLLEISENCLHCSAVAHRIMQEVDGLKLYVPADHDEVINMAFNYGHISERGILEADCRILEKRDFVLAYARGGYVSRGMRIEIRHALAVGNPVVVINSYCAAARELLYRFLNHISHFRGHVGGIWGPVEGHGDLSPKNYLTEVI